MHFISHGALTSLLHTPVTYVSSDLTYPLSCWYVQSLQLTRLQTPCAGHGGVVAVHIAGWHAYGMSCCTPTPSQQFYLLLLHLWHLNSVGSSKTSIYLSSVGLLGRKKEKGEEKEKKKVKQKEKGKA